MSKFSRGIKNFVLSSLNKGRIFMLKRSEIKNIERKKYLFSKVNLTKEQNKQIQDYFKKYYGKKISTKWHRLYQSYTGNFDVKYFPEILFSTKLEGRMSDRTISDIMTDKSMVELLYKDIDELYIPKTTVLNCSGIWYDENRNIITKEKAYSLLKNCKRKVWKKIKDSSSGRSVMISNIQDGYDKKNHLSLEELLNLYDENFIVQECIVNNKELSNLYNKSLNTFRVITYVVNGKIYHVPISLRIGKDGNEVDNIHAGGIFIGVSDKGILRDEAFTEYQERYSIHPDSKVKFEGYKINGVDKIIEIAKKCHGRTPHLGMISWDFTINEKNQITLIEVNLNGQSIWFPQMANGCSAFGDNTEYMLKLISKNNK